MQKSIEKFVKFPIAYSYGIREPRLLVIGVDATEGIPITFDSYEGIKVHHVMASASLPEFYEYEEIDRRKFWDGGILSNTPIRELIKHTKTFGSIR